MLAKPFAADTDFGSVRDSVYDVESSIRVEGVDYGVVQLGLSVTALQQLFGSARNRITLLALAAVLATVVLSVSLKIGGTFLYISLVALFLFALSQRIGAG